MASVSDDEENSSRVEPSAGDDRRFLKHVHDNVHGNLYLDHLWLKFIHAEQFQRLCDLKQLGLLHDVAHGPFSHMFGREFILTVKDMVVASAPTGLKEKSFLYDIVANGRNSIDVDKCDYIIHDSRACGLGCNFDFSWLFETMGVIDDEICYRVKEYLTAYKVFSARSDLHWTVYMHSKVKCVDAMIKAHSSLQITSSYIKKPADYWKVNLLLKSKKLCATSSVVINYGGEDSDNKREMQIFWSPGFCRPEARPRFGDLWSTRPSIFTSTQEAEVEGEVRTDNEVVPIPVLFSFYNGAEQWVSLYAPLSDEEFEPHVTFDINAYQIVSHNPMSCEMLLIVTEENERKPGIYSAAEDHLFALPHLPCLSKEKSVCLFGCFCRDETDGGEVDFAVTLFDFLTTETSETRVSIYIKSAHQGASQLWRVINNFWAVSNSQVTPSAAVWTQNVFSWVNKDDGHLYVLLNWKEPDRFLDVPIPAFVRVDEIFSVNDMGKFAYAVVSGRKRNITVYRFDINILLDEHGEENVEQVLLERFERMVNLSDMTFYCSKRSMGFGWRVESFDSSNIIYISGYLGNCCRVPYQDGSDGAESLEDALLLRSCPAVNDDDMSCQCQTAFFLVPPTILAKFVHFRKGIKP